MHVYLIPAMGCDARIYDELNLAGHQTTVLKWTDHQGCETLHDYAKKLALQIDESKPFALVGISMGGMLSMEISQILAPEKVILISSARGRDELPFLIRFAGTLRLHKLLPAGVIKFFSPLSVWFMSIRTKAGRNVFQSMLRDTTSDFLKFSIAVVVTWKKNLVYEKSVHFHGDRDRTLPLRRIKKCIVVPGLGHASMLGDWSEMQQLLLEELAKN